MRLASLSLVVGFVFAPGMLAAQRSTTYTAIWGSSAADAWIVGTGPNVMHWDGTAWSPMALPGATAPLNAVWGSGPGDVWAVGDRGRVMHYQNGTWVPTCIAITEGDCERADLVAVGGFSANDLYVAAQSPASDMPPRLFHFDGRRWEALTVPLPFHLTPRAMALVGAEIVLVGFIRHDPTPRECPVIPGAGPAPCIQHVGVIARLHGQQWTVTASADAAAGGIAWMGLAQEGRSLLLFGKGMRVVSRQIQGETWQLLTSSWPITVRGPAAGFQTWTPVAQPTGSGVERAALFARDEIVATTPRGFARRRLGAWTMIPVPASGEAGAVVPEDLAATALWGATAADVWFLAGSRVIRLEGNVPSLAFDGSCESLGARAAGTAGCALYQPASGR